MTINDVKEELSNSFIQILASIKKYKLNKPKDTGGVDFSITYDVEMKRNGKSRFIESGKYVDLQLKATTKGSSLITITESEVKYDLESKAYNDLIDRKKMGNAPLILVLFVLPNNISKWVTVKKSKLSIKKCAYWFYPNDNDVHANNDGRKRIKIPIDNRLDIECVPNFFNDFCK